MNDNSITIIASYTPLEAVVAASIIKNRYCDKVKIVYYSTDTLSNEQGNDGILSQNFRTKAGIKWEKKLFSKFDLTDCFLLVHHIDMPVIVFAQLYTGSFFVSQFCREAILNYLNVAHILYITPALFAG